MAISSSKCQKLLGIKNDNKLTFETYVRSLCEKASPKLEVFLEFLKLNSNLNPIHERALTIVCQDHN